MSPNKDGNTLLHFAAVAGHVATIQRHLRTGDDVNAQNKDGNTPLHIAFINQNLEAAAALIQAGANSEIENLDGKRPRDYIKDA